jgi:hypothetical protein
MENYNNKSSFSVWGANKPPANQRPTGFNKPNTQFPQDQQMTDSFEPGKKSQPWRPNSRKQENYNSQSHFQQNTNMMQAQEQFDSINYYHQQNTHQPGPHNKQHKQFRKYIQQNIGNQSHYNNPDAMPMQGQEENFQRNPKNFKGANYKVI